MKLYIHIYKLYYYKDLYVKYKHIKYTLKHTVIY